MGPRSPLSLLNYGMVIESSHRQDINKPAWLCPVELGEQDLARGLSFAALF